MLFRRQEDQAVFAGTAVLVHPDGYLLTASNLFNPQDELVVSPWESGRGFVPTDRDTITTYPTDTVLVNEERGLALLQLEDPLDINMPPHVIGKPDSIPTGSSVASLGYAFGYDHIYNQVIQSGIISARILSGNGTKLFLFDTMIHEGSRGGPLVNLKDRRIIGINYGKFKPHEAAQQSDGGSVSGDTNISYAVSIEYGMELLQGIEP